MTLKKTPHHTYILPALYIGLPLYPNPSIKKAFLYDGARFLRMVGDHLVDWGFDSFEVSRNKGGIAVSGEVYADFHKGDYTVHVELSAPAYATPHWSDSRPHDHVTLRMTIRHPARQESRNLYINPNLDDWDIATEIARLFEAAR